MVYTIELEKLTETQLEALRAIDTAIVDKELKRRLEESIYTDEEARRFQIYTDLSKAYFYLKPLYDNMRNNDVKKTITQSGILATLEKAFRTAKAKNVKFEKYEGEPVAEATLEPEKIVPLNVEPMAVKEVPAPVVAEPVAEAPAPVVAEPVAEAPAPVVNMSPEELNKILANIPSVTKI